MKSDLIKNINADLRTLHRKWGLNGSFEMSGGFFMNYAQLGLNNLGTNKKNQLTWADFFNLEVGLIPQNEDEWRIVFEKTSILPPRKFSSLRNELRKKKKFYLSEERFENRLDKSFMNCRIIRPSRSSMAYDLIHILRINEWFEESKKESWERLHFCQDTGDKGRKIILVGRGFGYALAEDLKKHFDIYLELRPKSPSL